MRDGLRGSIPRSNNVLVKETCVIVMAGVSSS